MRRRESYCLSPHSVYRIAFDYSRSVVASRYLTPTIGYKIFFDRFEVFQNIHHSSQRVAIGLKYHCICPSAEYSGRTYRAQPYSVSGVGCKPCNEMRTIGDSCRSQCRRVDDSSIACNRILPRSLWLGGGERYFSFGSFYLFHNSINRLQASIWIYSEIIDII